VLKRLLMHKLAFDTSALISLEVASLMSKVSECFRVFIPKKVREELKEVAKYGDIHGKAANRILKMERIEITEVGDANMHLIYVDEGEAEALELAKKIGADYLICDDYESFWYLSEHFEKTVFSVFVVRHLCEKGIISMEEGWNFIERIRERRTWGDNIIYRTAKTLWGGEEHSGC
jgi:predicted nucleic acid-binding protein